MKIFYQARIFIQKLFGFSIREANGFFVIIFLMIIVILTPVFTDIITQKQTSITFNKNSKIDSLVKVLKKQSSEKKKLSNSNIPWQKKEITYKPFAFNPNTASADTLMQLGFTKEIAHRIIKYRTKVGRFNQKQDLLKIYGIDEERVKKLSAFIQIKNKPKSKGYRFKNKKAPEKAIGGKLFEINEAKEIQFQNIKGIGPKMAKRIIKYKNLLGGYVRKKQLNEIYGLKNPELSRLKNNIKIDTTNTIKKLYINKAPFKKLLKHPYLNYDQVKTLVKSRNEKGEFLNYHDLKRRLKKDTLKISQLKYYLTF